MNRIKKITAFVLSALLIFSLFIVSPSTVKADNKVTADKLKSLGLFLGTNNGYELDRTLTRAEAATLIVRAMGVENQVKNGSFGNQFKDVPSSHWANKQINYCYKNGITKGASSTEFAPGRTITGSEFTTLLMRAMGYTDAEPGTVWTIGVQKCLFTSKKSDFYKTNNSNFLRDYAVEIIYRALTTKCSNGYTLAENLVTKGVFKRGQGIETGVIFQSSGNAMDDLENAIRNKFK
ncbi:MAG: S-layer homology domain-containing protein [Clostridiales bacterium]|nr:S-layer homology domain-containing protein [Clostridiales bacterium]